MSAMSNYFEDALVAHLNGTRLPLPANYYVALFTTATDDASGGTEVSGNNYARVAIAASGGSWAATAGGNGVTSNAAIVTFPTSTGSWGTVSHFALYDASSAGNRWIHGALSASQAITASGITATFTGGQLVLTFA